MATPDTVHSMRAVDLAPAQRGRVCSLRPGPLAATFTVKPRGGTMHSALRAPGRRASNRSSLPSRQWLTLLWVCGEMTLHLKVRCLVPEQTVHASQGWQVGRLRVSGGCG